MNKIIHRIIYRKDGGISVISPAPKSRRIISLDGTKLKNPISLDRFRFSLEDLNENKIPYELESESEWLTRVFDKSTPGGVEYKDTNEISSDRRFRNAWVKGKMKAIEVDLSKAKEQVMGELRTARDKELTKTDGLMARANEIGSQTEIDELKTYRQKLRNLPVVINIEKITTTKDLQNQYPEIVIIENLKKKGKL